MQLFIISAIAILSMGASPAVAAPARIPDNIVAKRFDSEEGFTLRSTHHTRQEAHDWESSSKPSAVTQPEATSPAIPATSTPDKRSLGWYKETSVNKANGGMVGFRRRPKN